MQRRQITQDMSRFPEGISIREGWRYEERTNISRNKFLMGFVEKAGVEQRTAAEVKRWTLLDGEIDLIILFSLRFPTDILNVREKGKLVFNYNAEVFTLRWGNDWSATYSEGRRVWEKFREFSLVIYLSSKFNYQIFFCSLIIVA